MDQRGPSLQFLEGEERFVIIIIYIELIGT